MSGHSRRNGFVGNAGFVVLGDPPMTPRRSNGVTSPNGGYVSKAAQEKEGFTGQLDGNDTPAKVHIGANITPRSGSRKARQESVSPQAQSTPNGASRPPRSLSVEKRQMNCGNKVLKFAEPYEIPIPSRSVRSDSVSSDGSEPNMRLGYLHGRSDTALSAPVANGASKFFHANDAPPSKTPRTASAEMTSRPSSASNSMSKAAPLRVSPMPDEDRSKFFYASEIPDAKPIAVHGPVVNGANKRPYLPTILSESVPQTPQTFRPSSPLKEEILMDSPESITSSPIESPEQAIESEIMSRRSSINQTSSKVPRPLSGMTSPSENRKSGHNRKSSLNATRARKSSLSTVVSDQDGLRSPPVPRMSRLFEPQDSTSPGETPMSPPPLSPVKGQSQLDHLNELAAKARRERKVLDLEISNSSLLAINQTLEREMRKMQTELRHFRRLSRPSRIPSAQFHKSKYSMTSPNLEDDPSQPSESESDDEDDNSSLLSTSKIAPSIRPPDENGTIKFKDRSVEPIDMSKQQKLLEDSQSLNQTIRRCLGFSDNLLRAGKEALETKSSSSAGLDILGPRVLSPDEISHEIGERRQGLLTPVIDRGSINPWERTLAARSKDSSPESIEEPLEGDSTDSIDPAIYDASSDQPDDMQATFEPLDKKPDMDDYGNDEPNSHTASSAAPDSPSPFVAPVDPVLTPVRDSVKDSSEALRKLQGEPPLEAEHLSAAPSKEMPPPLLPASSEPSTPSADKNTSNPVQEQTSPETTIETTPNPTENTPGNRSSVTKYLASFWTGATKLRPP